LNRPFAALRFVTSLSRPPRAVRGYLASLYSTIHRCKIAEKPATVDYIWYDYTLREPRRQPTVCCVRYRKQSLQSSSLSSSRASNKTLTLWEIKLTWFRATVWSAVQLAAIFLAWSAIADPQQECASIFDKAPKNTTDITDRSRELLTYGRSICSSSWKTLSDVQNSHQALSLSVLDYIGLTSNNSDATNRFENWKKENCDKTDLKQSIFADLVVKQSFTSDLVYKAYQTCITQRANSNAATCSFVPTTSKDAGFLFVYFAPNAAETETTLEQPITLHNGTWDGGTNVLPNSTTIRLRENFFALKRSDITKGDFFSVSLKGYPGACAVQIPPWPTFNATLSLNVYYTQEAIVRTRNFPINWNAQVGMGPSWLCVDNNQARATLGWNDQDPFDYHITDPQFNVTYTIPGLPIAPPRPNPIVYSYVDKTCGYFGPRFPGGGTYSFLVTGERRRLLGTFNKVAVSHGEPMTFKIQDWVLPNDAAPGSKITFEYKIQISEQRDNIASPVITVSSDHPAERGYQSSIDSAGVVTLTYQ
jgi:hypothetical protein